MRHLRPTRRQKGHITAAGLDARDWLIVEEMAGHLLLAHKKERESRLIKKEGKR